MCGGSILVAYVFGFRYFVTFVEDYSRTTWIYLLKYNHKVFSAFQLFYDLVKTQFNTKIKVPHSDNGGEYLSYTFTYYLSQHGIFHQTMCPNTP